MCKMVFPSWNLSECLFATCVTLSLKWCLSNYFWVHLNIFGISILSFFSFTFLFPFFTFFLFDVFLPFFFHLKFLSVILIFNYFEFVKISIFSSIGIFFKALIGANNSIWLLVVFFLLPFTDIFFLPINIISSDRKSTRLNSSH